MYYSFQQAIKWEKMTGECHLHHEISNNEEKNAFSSFFVSYVFPFFFFTFWIFCFYLFINIIIILY